MNIFISADIEGVAGINSWSEATPEHPDYPAFQCQMTAEVNAACKGVFAAGAQNIIIKDAHNKGRNLILNGLPKASQVIRGWSGHPFHMMSGLDANTRAAMMIGYHSRAGSNGNPLSHTLSGKALEIRINEQKASEFLINTYTATYVGVPVILVSGDQALCDDVKSFDETIETVATTQSCGSATKTIHPDVAIKSIQAAAEKALKNAHRKMAAPLPTEFYLEVEFKLAADAFRGSFYPGIQLKNERTLQFETKDYYEILRLFRFVL